MKQAFLSHNSEDKDFVLEVARDLGYSESIIDSFNFEEGKDFRKQINDHLLRTDLFVLFASKNSLEAPWVQYEMNLAELFILNKDISNILVFLIGDATHQDLPSWLKSSLVKKMDSAKIAAATIRNFLRTSPQESLYVGRGDIQNKFNSDYLKFNKDVRNLIFHGLPGIGRRTLAKKAIKEAFLLEVSTEYILEEIDPLVSLYRDLLIDFHVIKTINEFDQYKKIFIKLSYEKQANELLRYLNRYAEHGQVPIILDNNGMLGAKGGFKKDVLELLKAVEKTDNLFVAYILNRNPQDYSNQEIFFSIYIPELSMEFTEHLLRQHCNKFYDILISKHDAKEIGNYLNGYPPTVELASYEISKMGVDILRNNPQTLNKFTSKSFEEYLEKYVSTAKGRYLLKLLSNFNNDLNLPVLDLLVPDCAPVLGDLITNNIVKVNHESKTYQISTPLLNSIGEKYGILTRKEYTIITKKLKDRFWNEKDIINNTVLSTIIHSLLRSDGDTNLAEFREWIVPSDILKTAKNAYKNKEWRIALDLFKHLLKINKNNLVALEYYIRSKIRLGGNVSKELNQLKSEDKDKYDLVLAFKLIKEDSFEEAIGVLEKIKEKSYFPPYVYRELGECYFQIGHFEAVQKIVDEGLEHFDIRKNSEQSKKYILDLAAKNAIKISNYELATEYIDKLEKVNDIGSVSHRKATLYFKQDMLNEALEYSTQSVGTNRSRLEFHLLLANILLNLGKMNDANEVLSKAEKKFSNNNIMNDAGFNMLRCNYYIKMNDIENAEIYFSKISNNKKSFLEIELLKLKSADPNLDLIEKNRLKSQIQELEKSDIVMDIIDI